MLTKNEINISNITKNAFEKYGYVIEFNHSDSNSFQIILEEKESIGWRLVVKKISERKFRDMHRHINSMESFEPVEGVTLLLVAPSDSPQSMEVFLLDKPVCIYKNIWHATICLSASSIIKISENREVITERIVLEEHYGVIISSDITK